MNEKDQIIEAAARFAQQQQGQPVQPQVVQPQPCPITIQLAGSQTPDGKKFVILIVHHMTGQSVYHLGADEAVQIGQAIIDAARVAKTGLEIATHL